MNRPHRPVISRPGIDQSGFTLIELLVVIAIVALLSGMLLGGVSIIQRMARSTKCFSCMRQLGMASVAYSQEWEGLLCRQKTLNPSTNQNMHFFAVLAPYLDFDADQGNAASNNHIAGRANSVIWGCPEFKSNKSTVVALGVVGYGMNHYLARPVDNRLNSDWSTPPAPLYCTDFVQSKISNPSTRMLFGDCTNWWLGYSGFYDLKRHGSAANYQFCDLHVQSVKPAAVDLCITNPVIAQP